MAFLGKDPAFYNLLEQQAEKANQAAQAFHSLATDWGQLDRYVAQADQIEHDADEITHDLMNRIDRTFVTPLDKEDLRALSGGLDDITDAIEAAVSRIQLYRLNTPRPDVEPMVGLLVKITAQTRRAIAALRHLENRDELHELFVQIHQTENESDDLFRTALQTLFDSPNPDPLMVIKWKEIYDRIEIAVDKCEDVANTVEGVVVKYA